MSTITREPVTHNLKIWPEYFAAVRDGLKRAELRWNDREYKVCDILDLCEWDPNEEAFTGDFISVTVTHVADLGQWMPGYVLLSIDPPAPVSVPEMKPVDLDEGFDEWYSEGESGADSVAPEWFSEAMKPVFLGTWRACRAAMLQGAEPVPTAYKLPEGYVLVPVEPTAEMISSGIAAHYERSQIQIHDRPAPGPMECAYVAMIATAPQQEVQK